MANLVLPSGSYGPLSGAFPTSVPTDGTYYLLKPYGLPPRESSLTYQEIDIGFPGIPGMSTKRFGGRFRFILAELMIIGASESAVETAKNAIMDALVVKDRYSVTVPGGTARTGCKLFASGAIPTDWEFFETKIAMVLQLVIRDLSGI